MRPVSPLPWEAPSFRPHERVFREAVRLTAIAAALLLLTVLTITRSEAAFSAVTSTEGSGFTSGTVVLTDDDAGNSLFVASGLSPLNPTVECIEVTYSGNLLNADVRMYGTSTGALAPFLSVSIEVGAGGSFGDCTGFTPDATLFSGTLPAFDLAHDDWSNGLDVFTASASPTSQTLRFSISVADDNAAQNLSAGADFVWEAREV